MSKDNCIIPGVPDELCSGLSEPQKDPDAFNLSSSHMENVAFHNFSSYEYVFEPWNEKVEEIITELTDEENQWLIDYMRLFDLYGTPDTSPMDKVEIKELFIYIHSCCKTAVNHFYPFGSKKETYILLFMYDFICLGLPALYEIYIAFNMEKREKFKKYVNDKIKTYWRRTSISYNGIMNWLEIIERGQELVLERGSLNSYDFTPFQAGSINLGLRLVYRQEWRSLGNQNGEIVRTIPLGPRQSEKVSIKIMRRNKGTRQMESIVATEKSTESSESSKDSSEIVEEATHNKQWEVGGGVEFDVGFLKGGGDAGTQHDSAIKSQESKKKLSETMQKTASKMRRETKVTVSTEKETSFEESYGSEIVNPNDEVAITYIYQRLQRQYEIHTYLAEVASVIFVAEELLPPEDINIEWIRRYDWIISKVLLDESFRETLTYISVNADYYDEEFAQSADVEVFSNIANNSSESIKGIAKLEGSISSIYDTALNNYSTSIKEDRDRIRSMRNTASNIGRFLDHVRDNVLHYHRAIWSHEDPDRRYMRYMEVYVPSRFHFVESNSPQSSSLNNGYYEVHGSWEADLESPLVRLSDIVIPSGPIGYAGNYAVFHLKDNTNLGYKDPLDYYRMQYAEPVELIISHREGSMGKCEVEWEITKPHNITYHPYEIRFFEGEMSELRYRVSQIPAEGPPIEVNTGKYNDGLDIELDTEGFRLHLFGLPAENDTIQIIASLPKLRDPELFLLRKNNPLPPLDSEAEKRLFDDDLIKEMLRVIPDLRVTLFKLSVNGDIPVIDIWNDLESIQQKYLRSIYHDFLLRREHTRRILVDTNSVVLNLHSGSGSTLESFKRTHRYIDAKKAAVDVERRSKLIEQDKLGDPDIERVTIVKTDESQEVLPVID